MKKNLKPIDASEFDAKFEANEDISDYIDYTQGYSFDDLQALLNQEISIKISDTLAKRLLSKSKELGLDIQSTIKAILAKELGLI